MSSVTHRTLKTAGQVLVVTALAAPSTGFAQRSQQGAERQQQIEAAERESQALSSPEQERSQNAPRFELEQAASDERQQIVEKLQEEIQALELQEGLNSADLIEPLTGLGLLYQEGGDYLLATVAIQRAWEIVRFNYGLHSLEQVPLIRQLIRNAEAIGSAETAWDLEQELLTLADRHPTDLRTMRILRQTADKRMDVLSRYNAGEWPPEIILGCYYEPPEGSFAAGLAQAKGQSRDCHAGSSRRAKRRLLAEAQSYYAQSIDILLENEQYGSDELPALLMELVHSSYAYNTPGLGTRSLRFLLAYQTTNSEPWLARIETLVQIADWDLLHSRSRNANKEALARYDQAHRLLKEQRIAQAAIEQIFSPETPVVLPAFLPNPLVSEKTQEASGYIDIGFEITKHGKARRVKVLDTTSNSTRGDERRLVEVILRSRFRPRMTSGRFADSGPLVVRYYLNE